VAYEYFKTIQSFGIIYSLLMTLLVDQTYLMLISAMTSIEDIKKSSLLTKNYFLLLVFFYTLKNVPKGV